MNQSNYWPGNNGIETEFPIRLHTILKCIILVPVPGDIPVCYLYTIQCIIYSPP